MHCCVFERAAISDTRSDIDSLESQTARWLCNGFALFSRLNKLAESRPFVDEKWLARSACRQPLVTRRALRRKFSMIFYECPHTVCVSVYRCVPAVSGLQSVSGAVAFQKFLNLINFFKELAYFKFMKSFWIELPLKEGQTYSHYWP